jgi:hypothetical protein
MKEYFMKIFSLFFKTFIYISAFLFYVFILIGTNELTGWINSIAHKPASMRQIDQWHYSLCNVFTAQYSPRDFYTSYKDMKDDVEKIDKEKSLLTLSTQSFNNVMCLLTYYRCLLFLHKIPTNKIYSKEDYKNFLKKDYDQCINSLKQDEKNYYRMYALASEKACLEALGDYAWIPRDKTQRLQFVFTELLNNKIKEESFKKYLTTLTFKAIANDPKILFENNENLRRLLNEQFKILYEHVKEELKFRSYDLKNNPSNVTSLSKATSQKKA